MDWLKALYGLLIAIPELIKLGKAIQNAMAENEIQGKTHEGVKQIHEALVANDSKHLNDVLAGKLQHP